MEISWEFVLSLGTISVAVIALFQTSKQTKLSNKHALFDRRIKAYSRTNELVELVNQNKSHLEDKEINDKFFNTIPLHFSWFTNSPELEKIVSVIDKEPGTDEHRAFLFKLAELDKLALESKLIFKGSSSEAIFKFIKNYREFLFIMYQYQLYYRKMSESADKFKWDYEKFSEKMNESRYQEDLVEKIKTLKENYRILNNEMKKIEKQIKL